MNNDSYIVTATKWSKTYFNSTLTTNASANLINRGSLYVSGTATINSGVGSWCLERSYTEVANFSNFNPTGDAVAFSSASDAASTAVINYNGTQNFSSGLTTYAFKYCRVGGTAIASVPSGSAVTNEGGCASVVPVVFGNILTDIRPNGVQISFKTLSEINTENFEVQRSFNGFDFQTFKTVKSAGNSANGALYIVFDEIELGGQTVYYRIISNDYDGKYSISPIVVVNGNSEINNFDVYPNPARQNNLFLKSDQNQKEVSVLLFDLSGKEIKRINFENVLKGNIYSIASLTENIPVGSYLIKIFSDSHTEFIKVYKE